MNLKVRFHPKAFHDLEESSRWYNIRVGEEFQKKYLDEVWSKINIIEQNPVTFPECFQYKKQSIRYCLLSKFPYRLIYFIHQNSLIILAIWHFKRKPNDWVNRL